MKIEKNKNDLIISGTAERDAGKLTFENYVGIDPDVKESGYALWNKPNRKLLIVTTMSFFNLFAELKEGSLIAKGESKIKKQSSIVVHIEGAWLDEKSNWHEQSNKAYFTPKEKAAGEKIAKNVGANHQIGKLIVEACILLDLSFVVRKPKKPMFVDQNYFKRVTGWKATTNADARSAANYIFGY